MRERRLSDQRFVGWGVYFFLLTWATLGIYTLVIFFCGGGVAEAEGQHAAAVPPSRRTRGDAMERFPVNGTTLDLHG